eukprot:COSAG04_NODE_730_length_10737_cov_31.931002_9_plen_80_part_00
MMTAAMGSSTGGPKADDCHRICEPNPLCASLKSASQVGLALSSLLHLVQPALPAHRTPLLSITEHDDPARRDTRPKRHT